MSHGDVAEIANTQSEDRARRVVFVYLIDGMIAHYITPISAKLKPGVLRSDCVDVGVILKEIIDGRFENSYLLPSPRQSLSNCASLLHNLLHGGGLR